MRKRKKLSELTLKDDFMFSAVMVDPKNCKPMLERILGINIASVEVDREKSMIYHPEYKGIRLDILATDENNTRYNVEMQIADEHNLPLRSRYYHSQMDMEILARGEPYQNLPSCIVIFICDFDPFHQDLCCYTIEHRCKESGEIMDDGTGTVFLNTCGKNRDKISPELAAFLDFVHADLKKSQEQTHDSYIKQLQESIQEIKVSREMGVRYVLFLEKLEEEYRDGYEAGERSGYAKGERSGYEKGERSRYEKGEKIGYDHGEKNARISIIRNILSEKGPLLSQLEEHLKKASIHTLDTWVRFAIEAENCEMFLQKIQKQNTGI